MLNMNSNLNLNIVSLIPNFKNVHTIDYLKNIPTEINGVNSILFFFFIIIKNNDCFFDMTFYKINKDIFENDKNLSCDILKNLIKAYDLQKDLEKSLNFFKKNFCDLGFNESDKKFFMQWCFNFGLLNDSIIYSFFNEDSDLSILINTTNPIDLIDNLNSYNLNKKQIISILKSSLKKQRLSSEFVISKVFIKYPEICQNFFNKKITLENMQKLSNIKEVKSILSQQIINSKEKQLFNVGFNLSTSSFTASELIELFSFLEDKSIKKFNLLACVFISNPNSYNFIIIKYLKQKIFSRRISLKLPLKTIFHINKKIKI